MDVLNFKNNEDCKKLMEQIRPIIQFFVKSLVIMNPDKHCTWSKVYLKQIVLRLGTSYEMYHNKISKCPKTC